MTFLIICLFLVLSTFISLPTPPDEIRTPKEIMAIVGFLSVIWACFHFSRPKGFILNKWLWLFVGWGIVDTFWIKYIHFQPGNVLAQELAFTTAFARLFYILLAVMTIEVLSNVTTLFGDKTFRFGGFTLTPLKRNFSFEVSGIIKFIAFLGLIVSGYVVLIQLPGFDQYLRVIGEAEIAKGSLTHRLVGTLGNPSVMATWFAMVIPCLLYSRRYLGLGFTAFAIYLSQGKTGIIAGIAALLFYLFFNNKKVFFVLITIILILGTSLQLTGKKDVVQGVKNIVYNFVNDDEGRYIVWKQTLKDFKQMPLTGTMLGSFQYVESPKIMPLFTYSTIWRNPHCEYLRILFETGIVGLFLYLAFCWSVIWKFLKSKKTRETVTLMSVSVAFLICCITLFPFQIGTSALLIVICVSLLMNLLNKEEEICFVK